MFPINIVTNQYAYFLNQLRMGAARHEPSYLARITKQTRPLANLLLRLNILRRVQKQSNQTYILFPSHSRFHKGVRPFKTYSRVNGRIRLTKKSIRLLNVIAPYTHYVLDTSKGLMTHKEALKFGLGGFLLLIIY